jgi:hypothetical protein
VTVEYKRRHQTTTFEPLLLCQCRMLLSAAEPCNRALEIGLRGPVANRPAVLRAFLWITSAYPRKFPDSLHQATLLHCTCKDVFTVTVPLNSLQPCKQRQGCAASCADSTNLVLHFPLCILRKRLLSYMRVTSQLTMGPCLTNSIRSRGLVVNLVGRKSRLFFP